MESEEIYLLKTTTMSHTQIIAIICVYGAGIVSGVLLCIYILMKDSGTNSNQVPPGPGEPGKKIVPFDKINNQ